MRTARNPKRIPDPPLQPLRVPTGWTVAWNRFFDVDPTFVTYDQTSWYFDEDMLLLQNEHRGVMIDLGWYPAHDARGRYRVVAVRYFEDPRFGWTSDFERPLRQLTTRSRRKIVASIDNWLRWYADHPPPQPRRAKSMRRSER